MALMMYTLAPQDKKRIDCIVENIRNRIEAAVSHGAIIDMALEIGTAAISFDGDYSHAADDHVLTGGFRFMVEVRDFAVPGQLKPYRLPSLREVKLRP